MFVTVTVCILFAVTVTVFKPALEIMVTVLAAAPALTVTCWTAAVPAVTVKTTVCVFDTVAVAYKLNVCVFVRYEVAVERELVAVCNRAK